MNDVKKMFSRSALLARQQIGRLRQYQTEVAMGALLTLGLRRPARSRSLQIPSNSEK